MVELIATLLVVCCGLVAVAICGATGIALIRNEKENPFQIGAGVILLMVGIPTIFDLLHLFLLWATQA